MSSFTKKLKVSPLPDGRNWEVEEPFTYHIGTKFSRHYIRVKKGFVTDFASTDVLQWIANIVLILYSGLVWILPHWTGVVFLAIVFLALSITPYGKQGKGAVLHDWLYHSKEIMGKPITRKVADDVFLEAMIVAKTTIWKARLIYYGVRIGGWPAWHLGGRPAWH